MKKIAAFTHGIFSSSTETDVLIGVYVVNRVHSEPDKDGKRRFSFITDIRFLDANDRLIMPGSYAACLWAKLGRKTYEQELIYDEVRGCYSFSGSDASFAQSFSSALWQGKNMKCAVQTEGAVYSFTLEGAKFSALWNELHNR